MKLRDRLSESVYWHAKRPLHSLFLFIIWHLPKKVVYWCVVRAATEVEKTTNPADVTTAQMLKAFVPHDE